MTLYASGEAPTVSIMDPIDIQENIENMAAYDLDEDSWITDQVDESYLDVFKGEDGKLYAVPNSVTAMGIVYNKTVIEKATGEPFDPSSIKEQYRSGGPLREDPGGRRVTDHVLPVWTGLWDLITSARYFPVFREMRRRSRTLSTA
ncbi:MAG: hypothetical protein ACLR2E_22925 [Lachnospiraceae bacterium]